MGREVRRVPPNWAPSMVIVGGKIATGIESLSVLPDKAVDS